MNEHDNGFICLRRAIRARAPPGRPAGGLQTTGTTNVGSSDSVGLRAPFRHRAPFADAYAAATIAHVRGAVARQIDAEHGFAAALVSRQHGQRSVARVRRVLVDVHHSAPFARGVLLRQRKRNATETRCRHVYAPTTAVSAPPAHSPETRRSRRSASATSARRTPERRRRRSPRCTGTGTASCPRPSQHPLSV